MDRLQPLLDWFGAHPHWTGIAVALVAFSESLAVVGLLVPGAAAMFAFGALIEAGSIDFWTVWVWAVAGAIAGDGISFWLGRRYRDHLARIWPLSRYPDAMERGVRFFADHGAKSVVIGRFVGPVRPIIPAVAGMMGMRTWVFAVANVGSALFWAPAYLLPGMVFAASLAVAAAVATRLAMVIVLALTLAWVLWRLALLLTPFLRRGHAALLPVLADRPALAPLAVAVAALRSRTGQLWWLAFGLVLTSLALATQARPLGWEGLVMEAMARLRTAEGRWVAWGLSQAGEPLAILLASGAAITVLAMARLRRSAMALALATAIGLLAALGLDGLLGVDAVPDGFPSMHAAGIALLAGGMALMQSPGGVRRKTALALAGCAVTVVAVSRVYLGATLPLAALAGAALGAVALAVVAFLRDSSAAPRRAMVAGLIALLAGACYTGWQERRHGLEAYPKPFVAPRVSSEADCERAVAELGRRPGYALWQGSHGTLMGLARRGWPPAEPWTLRGSLQWLRPSPELAELPPVPAILEGRGPEVSLQRVTPPEAERRLLHAWPAARGPNGEWSWWWLRAVRERLIPAWPLTLANTEPAELPGGLNTLGRLCSRPGDAS